MIHAKATPGYLLPSLITYAALVIMIVSASAQLAVLAVPVVQNLIRWCSYTQFYTALDFISREVACASVDPADWIRADTEGFIWKTGKVTKGVFIKKGALLYKEGNYNNGKWSQASTSLLARGCSFTRLYKHVRGDRVSEFYCRAALIKEPHHWWEYRWTPYA